MPCRTRPAAGVGIALQIGDTLILKGYGVVYRAVDNPEAGREIAVAHTRGDHSPVVEGLKPGRDGR